MPAHPHREKMRRCIARVRRRGGVQSPEAACAASVIHGRRGNPDVKKGDWLIVDQGGEMLGHYPAKEFSDEQGMRAIAAGFAENLGRQVLLRREGEDHISGLFEPGIAAFQEPQENQRIADHKIEFYDAQGNLVSKEPVSYQTGVKQARLWTRVRGRYAIVYSPSGNVVADTRTLSFPNPGAADTAYDYGYREAQQRDQATKRFLHDSYRKWLHLQAPRAERPQLESEWRRGYTDGARSIRNPAASARELAEAFSGRPSGAELEVVEQERYHEHLANLAVLDKLELIDGVKIRFDGKTRLTSNETGDQLYFVGGDQSVNLDVFDVPDQQKELIPLGRVKSIQYTAAKFHLGEADKAPGPYTHEFKRGKGDREAPMLIYDRLNQRLKFSGGVYHIDLDMDGGRHSAGIRD